MFKGVEERLGALARVAKDLNAVSDEFSERLRLIEERLDAMNLGVSVVLGQPLYHVDTLEDLGDEVTSGRQYFLGYDKVGDRWRIVVRAIESIWMSAAEHVVAGGDDEENRRFVQDKPLLDSSRDLRLAAVTQINKLLEEIQTSAEKRVANLGAALSGEPAQPQEDSPDHLGLRGIGGRVRQRRGGIRALTRRLKENETDSGKLGS